jgi:hypothetical protein
MDPMTLIALANLGLGIGTSTYDRMKRKPEDYRSQASGIMPQQLSGQHSPFIQSMMARRQQPQGPPQQQQPMFSPFQRFF